MSRRLAIRYRWKLFFLGWDGSSRRNVHFTWNRSTNNGIVAGQGFIYEYIFIN